MRSPRWLVRTYNYLDFASNVQFAITGGITVCGVVIWLVHRLGFLDWLPLISRWLGLIGLILVVSGLLFTGILIAARSLQSAASSRREAVRPSPADHRPMVPPTAQTPTSRVMPDLPRLDSPSSRAQSDTPPTVNSEPVTVEIKDPRPAATRRRAPLVRGSGDADEPPLDPLVSHYHATVAERSSQATLHLQTRDGSTFPPHPLWPQAFLCAVVSPSGERVGIEVEPPTAPPTDQFFVRYPDDFPDAPKPPEPGTYKVTWYERRAALVSVGGSPYTVIAHTSFTIFRRVS